MTPPLGGWPWKDVTAQLDLDKVPSISIAAERGDAALTAAASDLSLTVDNSEGVWDQLFDDSRIVGALPPMAGESVRAPAAHYGEVMFSRLSSNNALWHVAFVGFVTPGSVRFDRQARTCTFTAYSCANLLQAGNAERVHRFHAADSSQAGFVPARPFVLPVDQVSGKAALQHPAFAGGDASIRPTGITTTLLGGITNVATTLTVNSVTNFPTVAPFYVQIGTEIIRVDGASGTSFSPLERGALGTIAAAHSNGDTVTLLVTTIDDSWWRLFKGAVAPAIPLAAGDQFNAVQSVILNGWTEGMQTVKLVNTTFTIVQVVANGDDLFFQTVEAPTDVQLELGGVTASMELLNPWYLSRDWKALIDGSDGNHNCLEAEVNAALAGFDVSDVIAFNIAGSLPLLTVGKRLFAQPIFQSDVKPACSGVSYARYSGVDFLAHQRTIGPTNAPTFAKPDVLLADSGAAPFTPFAPPAGFGASNVFNPAPGGSYVEGPDDGLPVRLLSSSINDRLALTSPPDYATDDLPLCGRDIHSFAQSQGGLGGFFDSTNWIRAPSSYRNAPTEPKRYYRIYARGRDDGGGSFTKGWELSEFTTPDNGATWTLASNSVGHLIPGQASPATPRSSQSSRPSIRVFEIGPSWFLYVLVDPFGSDSGGGSAYAYESLVPGGDNVSAPTLVAGMTQFLFGPNDNAPILSSCALHWPGTTVFISDRKDRTGVDFWFYSAGPTWTQGVFLDLTGRGLAQNLLGADWINAIVDSTRNPVRLYVMVGRTLYAMQVQVLAGAPPQFRVVDWQAVPIDQVNYDPVAESTAQSASNFGAVAWLTGPVVQNNPGEPDYTHASDALIVASANAIYIVSNAAANIVDIADFEGLSVAAALAKLIILRAYFMLAGADQDLVVDPDLYDPVPTISFYARLQTLLRQGGAVDLVDLTEAVGSGTWLQSFQSVQVQNSKLGIGPVPSSTSLADLDGNAFTINPPRNAASAALVIDSPFITTLSFAGLLADLFAQEFVVPRPGADITVRDPYAQGSNVILKPGMLVKYLLRPPDSVVAEQEIVGRVLTVDYKLENGLITLAVA